MPWGISPAHISTRRSPSASGPGGGSLFVMSFLISFFRLPGRLRRQRCSIVAQGQPGFILDGFASNGYGDLSPDHYNMVSGAIIEAVSTFFFVLVVLGSTSAGAPSGFAPLAIGLTLTLILLVGIPVTNGCFNPARATGPAIFAGKAYIDQLWFFWSAPVIGGLAAGIIGSAIFRKPD